MRVSEICHKALETGLLKSEGKTPEATMATAIYRNMAHSGANSLFVKISNGKIALASLGKAHPAKVEDSANETFKNSAVRVLTEARKPLDVKTITERAIRQGYLKTTGKTPSATMGARLYTDVKERKIHSDFVQLGKNLFGLRKWDINALTPLIEKEAENERSTVLAHTTPRSIVGDVINVDGLIYSPLNENGVIFLFSKIQQTVRANIDRSHSNHISRCKRASQDGEWQVGRYLDRIRVQELKLQDA